MTPDRLLEKRKQRIEKVTNEILDELDLTPAQREEIQRLRARQEQVLDSLRTKITTRIKALKEELEVYESDETKVRMYAEDIGEIGNEILTVRVNNLLELKRVLTPEQYDILKEEIRDRLGFMRVMMKKILDWHDKKLQEMET